MNQHDEITKSPSYFWDCLTLNENCPFLSSTTDPKLYYFGISLIILYGSFLLMVFADLRFFWSLDIFQRHIDYYINLVRKKIRHVQMDQRRLVSTQERSEKLLKKTEECKEMVTVLRGAVEFDPSLLTRLTVNAEETLCSSADGEVWNDVESSVDY